MHELRPFQYNNTCNLCSNIQDIRIEKQLWKSNVFLLTRKLSMSFMKLFHIPTIEKLSFHIAHVRILGLMEYRKTRNDFFNKKYRIKEILCRK